MATSGSKSVSVTKSDTLKFSWSLLSQSVSGNYSKVSWKLQLISGSYGAIQSSASKRWSVKVNGKSYSGSNTIGIGNNSTKTLASGSTTINHNSDGKKTFSYSFSQTFDITFSGSHVGTKSGSGSGTLTTIPRASSMSVPNITIGNSETITISRASSAFTHTITVTFGSYSKTIVSKGTGTSYSFTPPMEWCNVLPNATSGTAVYKITTYNGSTTIGSKSYEKTLYVPSSVVPTVDLLSATEAVSGLASKFDTFIYTKSKVKFNLNGKGAYSSTIKSYSTKFNGQTLIGSSPTSGYLQYYGELTVKITVTDSRGRSSTKTTSINVSNYTPPRIKGFSGFRANASGAEQEDGINLSINTQYSITSLNNKNDNTYKIEYAEMGGTPNKKLFTGTGYNVNRNDVSNAIFNTDKTYILRLTVSDYFTSIYQEIKIPTAIVLVDSHSSGNGLGFGKVAEFEGIADFALTPRFHTTPEFVVAGRHRTPMQMFIGGANGDGIKIGAGGAVVIGGGESANDFVNGANLDGQTETTYITGDGDVNIITNMQNGYASRKGFTFGKDGSLTVPSRVYAYGGITLSNNHYLSGTYTDGSSCNIININSSNNLTIGYSQLETKKGNTYIYGGSTTRLSVPQGNLYLTNAVNSEVNKIWFYPSEDGVCSLGTNIHHFNTVYAKNGTISTSDRRKKKNITPMGINPKARMMSAIDRHKELFMKLQPVQYQFKNDVDERTFYGLIAQDVIEALKEVGIDENELNLVHHDFTKDTDEEGNLIGEEIETFGIAYSDLIPLIIHVVQCQQKEIEMLRGNNNEERVDATI